MTLNEIFLHSGEPKFYTPLLPLIDAMAETFDSDNAIANPPFNTSQP